MPDEAPKITDRRAARRAISSGIVVARGESDVRKALTAGRDQGPVPTDRSLARDMGLQRLANQRVASSGGYGGGASNVSWATMRPHDPTFYWQQNNLPFDTDKTEQLKRLRDLCRMIYRTHPVMASAIDIYSKWPIVDMEFVCKDDALVDFHSTLFFEQLDYEEFCGDIGREYWTVGEAWPLGSFSEELGVWEGDELINPDDVFVEKSPFLKEPRLYMRLPESLRKVLQTGQPTYEYAALMRSYPELKHFVTDSARMPVSNVLLKQLKFKADTFNPRGIPILMRALRAIMQEEQLNAAQDAVADRLYTPLILARLGASATDLGTAQPWVPTEDQISDFEGALDVALAADFRVLTTHFAVQMDSVFGRESMPNLDADFDRLTEKQLQAFGLSKTMLSGAGSGETYAADALNRDLISQLLGNYQRYIKRFVRERMLVVAEAQEHYDYEERGGKRYPIMEEVLIVDEESGEKKIIEQPKLLVPDLKLATMNMRDDETQRAFYEALRAAGVPISIKTRLTNTPIDLDDEIQRSEDEQVELAVGAQRVRRETYKRLRAEGLPIPDDLREAFEPKATGATDNQGAGITTRPPQLGVDDQDHSALAPTPQDLSIPPGEPNTMPEGPAGTVDPAAMGGVPMVAPQATVIPISRNQARPAESDEARAGMPRPAALGPVPDTAPREMVRAAKLDENKNFVFEEDGQPVMERHVFIGGLVAGPTSVGHRKMGLDRNTPLDERAG